MKKYTILLYVLLFIVAAFLLSCDNRGEDKPTLKLYTTKTALYGDINENENNYTDITFMADGNIGFIQNAKVLVNYDSSKGTFYVPSGNGAANYIILNDSGVGTGRFLAKQGAFGVVNLEAKMEKFQKTTDNVVLYLYDVPEIEEFYAEHTTIKSNGNTELTVKLKDRARNTEGQVVVFTSDKGLFESTTVLADKNGVAKNNFGVGNITGTVIVRASLGLTSSVSREITITVVK